MPKTDKFIELIKGSKIEPLTIFDVGAFDCSETLELAKAFPRTKVYAFEPVPKLISKADAALRSVNNAELIPVALGDATGMRTFYESTSANDECGSLLMPNGRYFEPMPFRKITIPVFTIEQLLRDCPRMVPPEVMWMDVQGNEINVLSGMGKHFMNLKMLWAEVTYTPYYHEQKCVAEFDRCMNLWGFEKIHEEIGIKDWFGNACYRRRNGT